MGTVGTNEIGYAVTSSMRIRPSDDNLVVGTHGNGMFQLALSCVNPTVAVTGNAPFCQGESVTLDAGTYVALPNTYNWTGGSTNQTVTYSASGIYTVTVTVDEGCTGTATTLDAGVYNGYIWSNELATQTISATAGTYTVTVSNADNCTATATVEVTENANSTPAIGGDLTYCIGGSTTLDAGVYNGYIWSNGLATQTISATAGIYTVMVTNTGMASVEVTANNSISVSISQDSLPCDADLDAGSYSPLPNTYVWATGETTQSIGAILNGIYTVTVTNNIGYSELLLPKCKMVAIHLFQV